MRAGIRGILVTFVILPSVLQAQETRPADTPHAETQPANAAEWFVSMITVRGEEFPRRLVRSAPLREPEVMLEIQDPEQVFSGALLDRSGQLVAVKRVGKPSREGPRTVAGGPASEVPFKLFEKFIPNTQVSLDTLTVSPDGRWLVADYRSPPVLPGGRGGSKRILAIGDRSTVIEVVHRWYLCRPLSWSPDSARVAFYYVTDPNHDDRYIQKHGVAVLTTQGALQVILPAEEAAGTPSLFDAKDIPVGWSQSGRFLYYTDGIPTPPGEEYYEPLSATYRYDFETQHISQVASGTFLDVAPNDAYVLTRLQIRQDNHPATVTAQTMLATGEVRHLPKELVFPRVSPSGKFAVDWVRAFGKVAPPPDAKRDLQFYRTSDWQPIGEPIPAGGTYTGLNIWFRNFRWITLDSPPQPAVPTTQP
ncbi:MAG: hypothetical protein GXY55_03975 [Phycisphaerae bacterium]|nr:hypothetical protein [Phycisphaerae bacterium]